MNAFDAPMPSVDGQYAFRRCLLRCAARDPQCDLTTLRAGLFVDRYAQDYAIDWRGGNVLAKPHIRCGDARIHFYHDTQTNEIVVAYIGRHLRDKSTN